LTRTITARITTAMLIEEQNMTMDLVHHNSTKALGMQPQETISTIA
jgi:hypothetical protein